MKSTEIHEQQCKSYSLSFNDQKNVGQQDIYLPPIISEKCFEEELHLRTMPCREGKGCACVVSTHLSFLVASGHLEGGCLLIGHLAHLWPFRKPNTTPFHVKTEQLKVQGQHGAHQRSNLRKSEMTLVQSADRI